MIFYFVSAPGVNNEITKFLQGFIDGEANLNPEGSCALTCGDYQNTKNYGCYAGSFCSELKSEKREIYACKGRLRGCQNIDDSINVCLSVSKLLEINLKRFVMMKSSKSIGNK